MNPWTPLVAATFGWSAGAVMTRAILLRGVNTWTLIPLRMTIALLSLLPFVIVARRFRTTDAAVWKRGAVLGVVSMAVPGVLMTLGLEDLPVSLGGLLIALVPIATIFGAHFLVPGEKFQTRSLPGLLIALVGSAILVGVGGESMAGVDNLWRGVAYTVAGVLLAGVGGALSRRFSMEVPSDQLVLPEFAVSTLFVVVTLPLFFDFQPGSVDGTDWLLILGIGTIGTTLAFGTFLIAAGLNPASRLGMVGYSVPVGSVILAVIFLGETLTTGVLVGAVLITSGLILTERTTSHVPEPGVATAR